MAGQLKSHLIPKLYVPTVEEATGLVACEVLPPGGAGDENYVMSIAGNIKRRVSQQLTDEVAQNTAFSNATLNLSAHDWTLNEVCAVRIFFDAKSTLDTVLPAECEPSTTDLLQFQELLNAQYDEHFFRTPSMWNIIPSHAKDFRILARKICMILRSTINLPEGKSENYSSAVFRSLADCLNFGDPTCAVGLEEKLAMTTKVAGNEYKSIIDFALTDSRAFGRAKVFTFVEKNTTHQDKRRTPLRAFCQKAAEALAIAGSNFEEAPEREEDQEVFGITVRHRYFTFWHGVFPWHYLHNLNNAAEWTASDYAILKCFPKSNFGLDICNPSERAVIVRCMLRILKYIESDMRT